MKRLLASLLLLATMVSTSFGEDAKPAPDAAKIINHLQEISVTIKAETGEGFLSGGGSAQGSGVLFTRKDGDDTTTYVWTAGHVVAGLKCNRSVLVNGSEKTITEFKDAQIVREFQEDGRKVGETKVDAKVLRFSDAETGEDLALLQIRKKNFAAECESAEFYNEAVFPAVGTKLYHVGSLLGQFGSNSLTQGAVSQTGRVLQFGAHGVVFDQTTVTAFPGSSGGGVFLESDGRYMGMLVRGAGEQFNFVVPIRRMHAWAKEAKVEWALDRTITLPCADDLSKLPIEDAGSLPGGYDKASAASPHSADYEKANKQFPFLLKTAD